MDGLPPSAGLPSLYAPARRPCSGNARNPPHAAARLRARCRTGRLRPRRPASRRPDTRRSRCCAAASRAIAGAAARPFDRVREDCPRLSSTRTIGGGFLARRTRGALMLEQHAQIQRPGVFRHAREALADFGAAQPLRLELMLDGSPERAASPGELPRRSRFALAQHPPRLREGQLLRIVAGQPEAVAWLKAGHGVGQGAPYELNVAVALGFSRY